MAGFWIVITTILFILFVIGGCTAVSVILFVVSFKKGKSVRNNAVVMARQTGQPIPEKVKMPMSYYVMRLFVLLFLLPIIIATAFIIYTVMTSNIS